MLNCNILEAIPEEYVMMSNLPRTLLTNFNGFLPI